MRLWQSVDRLRLGEEIARQQPGAAVLVQVNLTDDPDRGGTKPGLAAGLVEGLRDLGLDVRGLMAVAPPGDAATRPGPGFRVVRDLADRLSLAERSIGMSDDLEAAVQEGSTMVRVGSALFGPRPRLASYRRGKLSSRGTKGLVNGDDVASGHDLPRSRT